ncbi:MAG: sporulation initiation factor Spo0A C-terminal domain-containing protein [Hespellia sp.]|nr:sporulation initiation factor Spo0A C-terminal domain-containing protein [Hespellia sp.]
MNKEILCLKGEDYRNARLIKMDSENEWILRFVENEIPEPTTAHIETSAIHEVLLNIGIPTSLLGYPYIIYATELIDSNPEYLNAITKGLYVDIAKKYSTTPSRVERSIRHAISVGWTKGSVDFIQKMFLNSVNPERGVPTNSQFLSRLYFYLSENLFAIC